jgi:hypothetical protein
LARIGRGKEWDEYAEDGRDEEGERINWTNVAEIDD